MNTVIAVKAINECHSRQKGAYFRQRGLGKPEDLTLKLRLRMEKNGDVGQREESTRRRH